jgi:hypothetical protein
VNELVRLPRPRFRAAAGLVRLGAAATGMAIHRPTAPSGRSPTRRDAPGRSRPIFVTNTVEQCAYILGHARVAVADIAPAKPMPRGSVAAFAPRLETIVLLEGESGVLAWSPAAPTRARQGGGERGAAMTAAQRPDDVATLIHLGRRAPKGGADAPNRPDRLHGARILGREPDAALPASRAHRRAELTSAAPSRRLHLLRAGDGGRAAALGELRPTISSACRGLGEAQSASRNSGTPLRHGCSAGARHGPRRLRSQNGAGLLPARRADRLVLSKLRTKLGSTRRHAAPPRRRSRSARSSSSRSHPGLRSTVSRPRARARSRFPRSSGSEPWAR